MACEEKKFPHSAIASWNGFSYQGKVALYHTLKLLLENIELDYFLQLDSLEDFAILNEVKCPVSLHQVKAYKSTSYSQYLKDFNKLNEKKDLCESLYFHTAKEIHDKKVIDIETAHPNIKMYYYDDNPYCSVENIDKKIENMCKKIYTKYYSKEEYKKEMNYCNKTRGYLDQIILKKCIEIHQKIHDSISSKDELAFKEVINFSEIKSLLSGDLNEKESSSEYYLFLIIKDFHYYYQIYCLDNEEELEINLLKKLSFYMYQIEKFSTDEMKKFIKNIMPHREFKFETISDYKDNGLNKDEVRDAFFEILNELKEGEINCSNNIVWNCSEGLYYSPTTICVGERLKPKMCQRIIENALDGDLDILFECNNLITLDMSSDSIYNDAKNIKILKENYKHKNITQCKQIKLISLDEAKGIIR